MEFYKKILSNQLYQGSQISNFQLSTFFYQDNRPLPLTEMEPIVDEYQRFVKERNDSTCYRLHGVLRGLFSNVLFNITGDKSYQNILALTGTSSIIFQNFGYKDILLEKDGWFHYIDNIHPCHPKCENIYLRPIPNDFYFLPEPVSGTTRLYNGGPVQNWFFKISYPYTGICSTIHFSSPYILGPPSNATLCDGIVIQNINTGTTEGRFLTFIETPINHGLLEGDQVIIRPFPGIVDGKVFNVVKVENQSMFWINYWDTPATLITNSQFPADPLRFKRIFEGVESQYLERRFSAITEINDYQIYKSSFSHNIYNDPIQLFHYQTDVNTTGIKDYLNRPLTELFLTKIKFINPGITVPDMEPWTQLAVGLPTNFPNVHYDVRAIYGGSPLRPYPTPLDPMIIELMDESKTEYFGDIVDYNQGDLTERILVSAEYRFNTNNREDNEYGEGYFYQAHERIKLRDFSSQIEQENLTLPDVDVPDYSTTISGITQWRDILTPGFYDQYGRGVNYPFLNGCNYIYIENDLCLKRQNPSQNRIYSASTNNINYWLNGVNCNNIFGEYIEPINGKC
jgi:hypothetical protein